MPEAPENRELLELWRGGDEDAAKKLFDCYAARLLALARKRISQRMARRVDPEDIVQSVFRTFFARAKEGQFKFDDEDDLCKLLVRITVHKTLRHVEFHKAAKRDPGREAAQADDSHERVRDLLDSEPTPQAAIAFLDELENFLDQLRPEERQILEMRLQGFSNDEICAKLGIYDRKIRRVLERIRGLAAKSGLAH